MDKSAPFRLTGGLALCFAIAYLMPVFNGAERAMCLSLDLAFVGLCAVVWTGLPFLRFPAALLPTLPLLLVREPVVLAGMGASLFCFAVIVLANKLNTEHWRYTKLFPLLSFAAILVILGTLMMGRPRICSVIFAVLFLFFGVVALRMLRMGSAVNLRWAGRNLTAVAAAVCGAVGLSFLLRLLLLPMRSFFQQLIQLFGLVIVFLSSLVGEAVQRMSELEEETTTETAATEATAESLAAPNKPGLSDGSLTDGIVIPWKEILIVLGVLLLLAALGYFIWRVLQRESAAPSGAGEYDVGSHERRRSVRRRKERAQSNVQKVRQLYREYLALVRSEGLILRKSTTSGEVLNNSPIHAADEQTLRGIYLLARYAGDGAVSDGDAEQAASCLERIKKGMQ